MISEILDLLAMLMTTGNVKVVIHTERRTLIRKIPGVMAETI